VLLEALSPVERAVFMLREVLGYGYPDAARIVGQTEVNCRQIFVRARYRIAAGAQARDSAQPPSAAGGRRLRPPRVAVHIRRRGADAIRQRRGRRPG
jgi:hypothetical protein